MSNSTTDDAKNVTLGGLVVLCGLLLLVLPVLTTIKIAFLMGWVLFLAGVIAIAHAFPGGQKKILETATGGLTAVAGIYLATHPLLATKSLILLIIVVALVRGFAGIFAAIRSKKDRAVTLVIAAIDVAIAITLLMVDLVSASRLVGIYIALTIILWGISVIVSARPVEEAAST